MNLRNFLTGINPHDREKASISEFIKAASGKSALRLEKLVGRNCKVFCSVV